MSNFASGVTSTYGGGQAANLQKHWLDKVAKRGGIDFASWNTAEGTTPIRNIIRASYRYYADLFLKHDHFLWAGMANAIAPTFAAAFDDLVVINRQLGKYDSWLGRLPGPIGDALQGALGVVGNPIKQFRHLENTLLSMQKEIFVDQSVMHEAYLGGGIKAIRQLRDVGLIDNHAVESWELIEHGRQKKNREEIARGNMQLLWREQMQVVADDYDAIRNWGPTSRLLTWGLTIAGKPSIPGASAPSQYRPIRIGGVVVPLPAFDVSRRDHRWAMALQNTLPSYMNLVTNQPAQLRQLIDSDLDKRIADARLRRLPDSAVDIDIARLISNL